MFVFHESCVRIISIFQKILNFSFLFFPGEFDYSVKLPTDRNQVIQQLSLYQKVDSQQNTTQLLTTLYKQLVDKHPIHKKLELLSNKDSKSLHSQLNLKYKGREIKRFKKEIAFYFFNFFEESPLTSFEKVLNENRMAVER